MYAGGRSEPKEMPTSDEWSKPTSKTHIENKQWWRWGPCGTFEVSTAARDPDAVASKEADLHII